MATTVRDSARTLISFQPPGQTNFLDLSGVSSVTPPSFTVDSREKTNFDSGNTKEFSPGLIDPGTISMEAFYNPSHPSSIELQRALNNQQTFGWRITLPEVIIAPRSETGMTLAIATTGIPTFSGGTPNLATLSVGVGVAFKQGAVNSGINYTVALLNDDGEPARLTLVTGEFPGSAITAAQYSIVQPSVIITFSAFMMSFTPSIETDANVTVSIEAKVTGAPLYTISAS